MAKKRNEIRIVDVEDSLYKYICEEAKKQKRTIGKQAEWILSQYMELASDNPPAELSIPKATRKWV